MVECLKSNYKSKFYVIQLAFIYVQRPMNAVENFCVGYFSTDGKLCEVLNQLIFLKKELSWRVEEISGILIAI